jgi:invasion protein IalB
MTQSQWGHARVAKRRCISVRKAHRSIAAAALERDFNLMTYWTASANGPVSRPLVASMTCRMPSHRAIAAKAMAVVPLALAFGIFAGSPSWAQDNSAPAATAPAKPKPPKKTAKPKADEQQAAPAAPAEAPPAQAQQIQPAPGTPPGQPAPQGQNAQQQVQLIYSPWTKFCLKGQPGQPPDPNAKQVCFTGKDARVESGQPVAAAVLIEPEGQERKILRVTLPLGMQLVHGTRVIVDQNQPMTAPYVICFTNGCMADYEANADMIGKLKKGQGLVLQAINATGQPISLTMPLGDFAKAYDGAPTDPKVFEEQQRKLQEELQRRADEARKKLEGQQGAPSSSAAPPPGQAPAPAPQAGK